MNTLETINHLCVFVGGRSSHLQNMHLKTRFELLWCTDPKRERCNSCIVWNSDHRGHTQTMYWHRNSRLNIGCLLQWIWALFIVALQFWAIIFEQLLCFSFLWDVLLLLFSAIISSHMIIIKYLSFITRNDLRDKWWLSVQNSNMRYASSML